MVNLNLLSLTYRKPNRKLKKCIVQEFKIFYNKKKKISLPDGFRITLKLPKPLKRSFDIFGCLVNFFNFLLRIESFKNLL